MKALLLILCFLCAAGAYAGTVIVQDGKPQAVIVTAEKPSATAKHAAEELQHFIELMSGAKLPVQTDAAPLPGAQVSLLVGRSRYTAGVEIPSGETRDRDREGFILKTQGDRIILAGNEDGNYHGTEYAVYDFLERLGCRWYYPGDFGQVVPKLKTIDVPALNVAQKPSFIVRAPWNSGWTPPTDDYGIWLLRNKGATNTNTFVSPGDGSIGNLAPPAKYLKLYPEIFAIDKNGNRPKETDDPAWTMLCTTNPKTVEIAAQTIGDFFRAHPEANSYGFSPPDNNALCYCPDCQARMHDFQSYAGYESISDPFFNFANNVAWAVTKDFPDKYITVMSYYSRVTPPEGLEKPWNPNIIVQSAQLWVSAVRPIGKKDDVFAMRQLRTLQAWKHFSPRMLIYDYDPHADLSRMPYWRSRAVAKDIRTYKAHGVIGLNSECQSAYFRSGLNYYTRLRCLWNVDTDADALIDDYCRNFFGPAAAPMKQFHLAIENMLQATPDHLYWRASYIDWTPTFPPARVAALGKLLDQAEAKANTPEIKARLSLYRLLHDYMTAYLNVFVLKGQGEFAEAERELAKLPPLIEKAEQIQRGLLPPDPGWVLNGGDGFSSIKNYLALQTERTDGVRGELLALAPEQAQFRTDPQDVGIFELWQRDDVAPTLKWQPISLLRDWGLNGFRDEQKYTYAGYGWYRIVMPVKKPAAGRAQLVVPNCFAQKMWIWVNGTLAYSPTTPRVKAGETLPPGGAMAIKIRDVNWLAVDIQDQLRPGAENSFVFRVLSNNPGTMLRGFTDRPYVWAPLK
ncbi:MAG: DUF4838 domain-containing protein [Armatimonadota bacterium]